METSGQNKPRGSVRNKLARTFQRVTKRSSLVQGVSNYKVTPRPMPTLTPSARNGSVIYSLSRHQELPNDSPVQRVPTTSSYNKPMNSHQWGSNGTLDYGGCDENIDLKAAKYILYVRERLKQERVDANAFYVADN